MPRGRPRKKAEGSEDLNKKRKASRAKSPKQKELPTITRNPEICIYCKGMDTLRVDKVKTAATYKIQVKRCDVCGHATQVMTNYAIAEKEIKRNFQ